MNREEQLDFNIISIDVNTNSSGHTSYCGLSTTVWTAKTMIS